MEDVHTKPEVSTGKGMTFALTSGILACIAGTFGKFAMTQSETAWHCENVCTSPYFKLSSIEAYTFCDEVRNDSEIQFIKAHKPNDQPN